MPSPYANTLHPPSDRGATKHKDTCTPIARLAPAQPTQTWPPASQSTAADPPNNSITHMRALWADAGDVHVSTTPEGTTADGPHMSQVQSLRHSSELTMMQGGRVNKQNIKPHTAGGLPSGTQRTQAYGPTQRRHSTVGIAAAAMCACVVPSGLEFELCHRLGQCPALDVCVGLGDQAHLLHQLLADVLTHTQNAVSHLPAMPAQDSAGKDRTGQQGRVTVRPCMYGMRRRACAQDS